MEQHNVKLARGASMPLIGFGTWQLSGDEAYRATLVALEAGYRLIDTATAYGNEAELGRALRESGVPRDEVFITTKLPPDRAGKERETIERSLEDLDIDHVDLWLVHWPPDGKASPSVWEQVLAQRDAGRTTDAGVSNYSPAQLDELVAATGEAPAVNQIPWAPSLHDPELHQQHAERRVVLEGYSPFARTDLQHPALADIAGRHGVTPAQVVLRWHLEHGIVAIPKSATPERIRQNLDVFGFSLDAGEVERLDGLAP